MEFETKPVIDPNRPEKIFTSSQVAMAMIAAGEKFREELLKTGMEPSLASVAFQATVIPIWTLLQHELGIEGEDGAYIDADEKKNEGRGR